MTDKELREFLGLMNENWVCVCEGCTRAKKNIRTLIDRAPTKGEARLAWKKAKSGFYNKEGCECQNCKESRDAMRIIIRVLGIEEGK